MSLDLEPHYTIAASDLANWLESQGVDRWWSVDGDPLLTGRLSLPCPADELAAELRRFGKPLIVLDRRKPPLGRGEAIRAGELDEVAMRLWENVQTPGAKPPWTRDRVLFLRWQEGGEEWLLIEDEETTRSSREDALAQRTGK